MAALVDTNILVYRVDPRFPAKQATATKLLREGVSRNSLRVPHQALVEFVAATTRATGGGAPLLTPAEAWREAEAILDVFPVLYPTAAVVRTAIRGAAVYGLPWFDAHLWAYADCLGLGEILSEDFQHGRLYGRVRVTNPFDRDAAR